MVGTPPWLNDLLDFGGRVSCVNSQAQNVLGRAVIGLRRGEPNPRRAAVQWIELKPIGLLSES